MPGRRDSGGTRIMAWSLFAALFLFASSSATACPHCLGAFRSSVAQQLVDLPYAVLAQPSADAPGYRVVAVIKGEQPALRQSPIGSTIESEASEIGSPDRPPTAEHPAIPVLPQ